MGANHTTTFTYTADSKVAKQTSPNGLAQTNTYDSDDRPTLMTAASSSKTIAKYTYGYDSAGQMTSDKTVDPSTTSSGVAHTYTYDTLSQLASATATETTSTYTATAAGVLSKLPAGTLATNSAQQLTKLTPTSGSATTYTYDNNGARLGSTVGTTTTAYTWAANGSLATVTLPSSGGTISYSSDGDGLRQTRKLGTTTTKYLWSHLANLPMLLDDGTNSYIYGPAGQVIEQIIDTSHTVQYLFHDLLGSIRLITSSTGATAGTYTYDAYGKQTGHTGTSTSGLGYTGNLIDASTGLLYLRARDYDPATGQFLASDPAFNLSQETYAYANNDPLLIVDLTGMWDGWDTLGAIGLGIGVLALAATGVGALVELSVGASFTLSLGIDAAAAVGTVADGAACAAGSGVGCIGLAFNGVALAGSLGSTYALVNGQIAIAEGLAGVSAIPAFGGVLGDGIGLYRQIQQEIRAGHIEGSPCGTAF